MWTVQKLELAKNKIHSMCGLQGHKYLEIIDLEENKVRFIFDVIAVITSIRIFIGSLPVYVHACNYCLQVCRVSY